MVSDHSEGTVDPQTTASISGESQSSSESATEEPSTSMPSTIEPRAPGELYMHEV